MTIETMAVDFVVLLFKQFSSVSQLISNYGFVLYNTVIKKSFRLTTKQCHTIRVTLQMFIITLHSLKQRNQIN